MTLLGSSVASAAVEGSSPMPSTDSATPAADAAPPAPQEPPVTRWNERVKPHLDFEIDPLAFAAKGFSLHAGIRWHHFRADLGVFGMDLPKFLQKDDRFTTGFAGFGAKLDYRFFGRGDGPFVGISAGRARVTTSHEASGLAETHYEHDIGGRIGYQIDVFRGFYVMPWVGLGYKLGTQAVTLDGDTLKKGAALLVFPTVHLGYRFG